MPQRKYLPGDVIGHRTILANVGGRRYRVRCQCGREQVSYSHNLLRSAWCQKCSPELHNEKRGAYVLSVNGKPYKVRDLMRVLRITRQGVYYLLGNQERLADRVERALA